jgi:hypothetical protein
VEIDFTTDELILTLVGLIRSIDPSLLRSGRDGIHIDFAAIERKDAHSEDERLLLRLRHALESTPADGDEDDTCMVEFSWADGRRLAEALDRLERLQPWGPDVTAMMESLRARLRGLTESAI